MYGPLVLAGELGPVDDPKAEDLMYVPVLVTSDKPVEQWVKPVAGKVNTFKLTGIGRPRDVVLYPFHNMHEKCYTIYWDIFTEQEWAEKQKEYERIKKEQLDLQARTVDYVQPGEQQSEVDHSLKFENSNASRRRRGPRSRHARKDGWFSYDLEVIPNESLILRVTYSGSDNEREYDIIVDGQKIAEQTQNLNLNRNLFDVDYKLPPELLKEKNKVTVKLLAHVERAIGSVFGVRVLKEKK